MVVTDIIKILRALLLAFPEVLQLLKLLQQKIDKAESDRKVKEDLRKINDAFENNDEELLRDVLNS
jgi:hypothetical protein